MSCPVFLLKLFPFFTEMGNWEVEEDDTLAVQDDDEVGKLYKIIKINKKYKGN